MAKGKKQKKAPKFLFKKRDYLMMGAGLVVILIGFLLMIGGGDNDPTTFNAEEVYHPLRITVAPILVMLGYLFEIYVILQRQTD